MCKCSICNKEYKESKLKKYSINKWDGFCYSSDTIHLCYECIAKNIIYTERGQFLTYNGYLYHYTSCCFIRINSQYEIDKIFNKDYLTISNIFENQNYERNKMLYKSR